jgi:lysophospholipase L1-like esterase
MQKDSMQKAFFITLIAGLLILLYPVLHRNSTFLSENFRTHSFTDRIFNKADIVKPDSLFKDSLLVQVKNEIVVEQTAYSGVDHLATFFNNLKQNNTQIRIAYYGDSSIEGDLISQTVRDSLQRRFGGNGVGFVPIIPQVKGFRRSIYQHNSDDWVTIKMNKTPPPGIALGYLGVAYTCGSVLSVKEDSLVLEVISIDSIASDSIEIKETDTIEITEDLVFEKLPEEENAFYARFVASKRYPGTSIFTRARLFYSSVLDPSESAGKVEVTIGDNTKEILLTGNKAVNTLKLHQAPCKRIELEFDGICNQMIYGVSFESERGVVLDNLPFRGNSGSWLTRIPVSVLNEFQGALNVDLVVLQYGLNVLNAEMKDYSWYSREMKRVVAHIKAGYPQANILLVGPADKSIKLEGQMQTDPSILLITNILREVSEESNVAFFSFYEAMGGNGSMVKWVEEYSPRLANRDYTHFNFEGAEKAGDLLLNFLLEAYENHIEKQVALEN